MPRRKQQPPIESPPKPYWIDWSKIRLSKHDELRYVRLVHKPVAFLKYYINGKSAIVANLDNPFAKKYGIDPARRYAVNVIDRAATTIRVLEGTENLFFHFRQFLETTGVDPGGRDACDFEIIRTSDKGKTSYAVRYEIQCRRPFTDEEKKLIQASFIDLPRLFRPTPNEQIEERLGFATGRC
jgi:hypothetical protein